MQKEGTPGNPAWRKETDSDCAWFPCITQGIRLLRGGAGRSCGNSLSGVGQAMRTGHPGNPGGLAGSIWQSAGWAGDPGSEGMWPRRQVAVLGRQMKALGMPGYSRALSCGQNSSRG